MTQDHSQTPGPDGAAPSSAAGSPGERHAPAVPGPILWRYSAAELWADGAVHVTGVVLALLGSVVLCAEMVGQRVATPLATGVYLVTLVLSIGLSAAYNMWPVTRLKWWLRRFDHSAIYLLIAGTYTPFMAKLGTWWLLAFVWTAAIPGVFLKLAHPGRFDRLSVALYLAIGWSGIVIGERMIADLSPVSLALLGLGGLAYTVGVAFHLWDRLKFQNAIWHGFVLVASAFHFGAIYAVVRG